MHKYDFFNRLENIIEDAETAVLATVDKDGSPRMRWMTPATLKGRQGFIYAIGAKGSKKVLELNQNSKVEWMIQSKALDRIVNIKGCINIIDNPSMKTEILHTVGKKLKVFWNVNMQDMEFVVLETVLEEAEYFEPMKGKRTRISFREGDE